MAFVAHPLRQLHKSSRINQRSSEIGVKRQMRCAIIYLLLTVMLSSVLVATQNYQVRTSVDLVVVPASVRDDKGQLVGGLTQNDFSIFEDDVPQTISNFS